ncbi:tetratricopeptide repeat protein [Melittangium boletus]|uniref:Tetratricopeptide repeat domain protein n=1 Tax=Melittangium boletus DSM 14713 TaxID=1294270 RepID=A0A250I9V6_9BACT|nr:tetratricopeptide repeat protein [Melittangium boletus]ATB28535.1 tetratricopeptide repeat domain protein [Melittangium boletus DSM 14713]
MALERIRRKVEAGEPLEAAELERLREAARNTPGPMLRLALAHAWMNAGAEREALGLLESLRRDFPQEVQVRLGLARALLGLERTGEAETALREALVLNPGDPEALKVLGVLALQRGEHARARALVAEVLERDPFDAEARLLKEELEAVTVAPPPPTPSPASRPEFTAALLAALHRAGVACRRQGRHLLVKLASGEVGRVEVDSLHAAYREGGRELAAAVGECVARLQGLSAPSGEPEALEHRVRPVLRPASFVHQAVGALHRPAGGGLEVFYVLEDEAFVRYLPEASLAPAGVSPAQVDAWAWRHLEDAPAPVRPVGVEQGRVVLVPKGSGLWAVAGGDGYDGSRLLTEGQRRRLVAEVGEGPWRVHLGWREFALICREADAAAVASLAGLGHAGDGIPGLFRLGDGTLEAV